MRIVFLDRDGVINKYPGDRDYVKSLDEFFLFPDSAAAIKRLNDSGFKVCLVSNQAGVGKGVFSMAALDEITSNMLDALKAEGAVIDRVSYCTHKPEDNCRCRKPKTGMLLEAFKVFSSGSIPDDGSGSFFIGDSMIDVKTARAAGVKSILVLSGREKIGNKESWELFPDHIALGLKEAVDIILGGQA